MSDVIIRRYRPQDYEAVAALYKNSALYGGQFDEARDAEAKLAAICERDPDAILVAEVNGHIAGTVSLIEDGRVAWLFRFAVETCTNAPTIEKSLYDYASTILCARGHEQVLVYAPADNSELANRYQELGFKAGGTYTCFWQTL